MKGDRTYDPELITQYLLGALPEADAARLDELSITDDEFAGAVSMAEKDLVDAYIQGELAGHELDQFKRFYLASPLRREKVEFARTFQVWSDRNATAPAAAVQSERPAKQRSASGWFGSATSRYGWQWGFAVIALLLLVAGGLLVFQNARLRQQITQEQAKNDLLRQREQELQREIEAQRLANSNTGQDQVRDAREGVDQEPKQAQADVTPSTGQSSIVSLVLAPPLRAANQVPTILIKPGTNRVAAQLQLEATDHSAYRVALVNPSGNQTLWRSGKLKAKTSPDGKALQLNFDAGLLKTQSVFFLRVFGTAADGSEEVIGDYAFKVQK